MEYVEIVPAPALRAVVRCYWFLSGSAAGGPPEPALPDGSPELILSLADPFVAVAPDGSERAQPRCFLVGQITGPFTVRPSGRVDLVGVRLEAHGATWLCDDLSMLTDDFVDVERQLGSLVGDVERADADGGDVRAQVLDAVLPALVRGRRVPDWRVRDAVREIRASRGSVDLGELAERLRTSPRSLQRLFARDVGITPKRLARIVRFQRVFAAWREDPARLSRVAAECGYFDHAHLVRDFRELAGVAPARFLPNQPEFTGFFTG